MEKFLLVEVKNYIMLHVVQNMKNLFFTLMFLSLDPDRKKETHKKSFQVSIKM